MLPAHSRTERHKAQMWPRSPATRGRSHIRAAGVRFLRAPAPAPSFPPRAPNEWAFLPGFPWRLLRPEEMGPADLKQRQQQQQQQLPRPTRTAWPNGRRVLPTQPGRCVRLRPRLRLRLRPRLGGGFGAARGQELANRLTWARRPSELRDERAGGAQTP